MGNDSMNNVLPLKPCQRRFTDEAQVQRRRNTRLPQEVGEPFDSKLFWLVCVPVSAVTVCLMVYAVWSWVAVNP